MTKEKEHQLEDNKERDLESKQQRKEKSLEKKRKKGGLDLTPSKKM